MDTNNPQGIGLAAAQEKIAALFDPQDNELAGDMETAEGDEPEANDADPEGDASDEIEEDAPDEEGEGEEEPRYTVKVDGEDVEVTQSELIAGYQKDADYRRKTTALAKEREVVEAEKTQVTTERAQYAELLGALKSRIEAEQSQEPDWDTLFDQNPVEATRLKHKWDAKRRDDQEQLDAINRENDRIQRESAVEAERARNAQIKAELARLPEVIPEWKDAKRADQERKEIKAWAIENGFTPEAVSSVSTVAEVLLLRKAWLYDKGSQRAAARNDPSTSPTLRPGAAGKPTSTFTRRQQQLAKTGRVVDAAKAIASLI